ncbi:hypothetical protein Q4601_02360 [Shewanella sp. 1_MG-2023]|uniref:tetratricopeptide repeat protein n=1 Tax=unclassified Shewanella TaxID=196818 RepID=UPI0026E25707|nr:MULTISPECIES: hypothetical protein [unclassified Shewanella]MDO6610726.1 hypothetical protein [Shewanella sp. 7_MG-2023]MDO6770851.1 hypothetical protein [Shewanella sp. 2_MG-2023]MDO6793131.1 hypothetical protein [Shewanella sp. 1_MG-2023]
MSNKKMFNSYFKKQLFTPLYIKSLLKSPLLGPQFNSKFILSVGVLSCSLLSACSSTTSTPSAASLPMPETASYFIKSEAPSTVPSIESLSELLPQQKQELNEFIARDDIVGLSKRYQVARFIEDKMVNFNYEGLNYSTSQAWQQRAGNCMALAMLTYGVAKHLDVRAVFQVVHSAPLLTHISNDLIVTSDHVRTFLYETDAGGVYLNGSEFTVIDYFPDSNDRTGGVVSEHEFIAMFYRNLAADALLAGELTYAYTLLEKGLSLAPRYVPLINMMAVVHRRVAEHQIADAYYQYGLQFESNSLSLLSNYQYSLSEQGKALEADAVLQQLLQLENHTPYGWYSMGIEALTLQHYSAAETYFKKFINNSPYYHQAYYELAKAQNALGKYVSAEKTIQQALSLTSMGESQQKYLAKLNWLKQSTKQEVVE